MSEYFLLGLAGIVVLGVLAQWISWRFKIPAILLLLIFGFVSGPVLGLLDPDALLGNLLQPLLSLLLGLILFESGQYFRIRDVHKEDTASTYLATVGALVTWAGIGVAAFYILGLTVNMSILLGAILVATGPSVVQPLLRHVRPVGRIGHIVKREGMLNAALCAIVAVLVLETVIFLKDPVVGGLEVSNFGEALYHAIGNLLKTFFVGLGVSVAGAFLLVSLLRHSLVPAHLKSAITITIVIGVFAIAEIVRQESGGLATSGLLATVMLGIVATNQRYVPVSHSLAFAPDIRALIYAVVFILFGARMNIAELGQINQSALLFLGILLIGVRPLAVLFSAWRSRYSWREFIFVSWFAPRGLVPAALIALFSFRLEEVLPVESRGLVPIVFVMIIGTVAIYGLTITPIAHWLKLALPNPQGVLFLGAQSWVRRMAKVLQEEGFTVLLIDSDPRNILHAQQAGLNARYAKALSRDIIDELDLSELGRMLVLTPNEEINTLATKSFSDCFEADEVYQLPVRSLEETSNNGTLQQPLLGKHAFGAQASYVGLNTRFISGASIKTGELSEEFTYADFIERYGKTAIPLFLVQNDKSLYVFTGEDEIEPQAGETLIAVINRRDRSASETDGLMKTTEQEPISEKS